MVPRVSYSPGRNRENGERLKKERSLRADDRITSRVAGFALSRFWRVLGFGLSKDFLRPLQDQITAGEVARYLFKKTFPVWQALGFHVVPRHFYEPIPDTTRLKDSLWQTRSELVGIDINEKEQLRLLAEFASKYKEEYESFPREKSAIPYQYYLNNLRYSSVDAEVLYCMIRHFRPTIVFEAGSGFSTYLSAQALLQNTTVNGGENELIVCDPYPNKTIKAGVPGVSRLLSRNVQDIPLSEFDKLKENDILFIDSSHVLKIGSDVQYEYLEILPRLKKGVVVHIHDIFLPAEYPRYFVMNHYRFWNEQYLLQAFLSFNRSFEVLWAGSYMHLRHPDQLELAFSSYNRDLNWPGSFWIRKID